MDNIKKTVAQNLKVLIKLSGENATSIARSAGVAPNTLSTFLNNPEERNLTLDKLSALAAECGVQPWVLLVPDIDLAAAKANTCSKIDESVYLAMIAMEKSPEMVRYSMLDALASRAAPSLPMIANLIRENQKRYLEHN